MTKVAAAFCLNNLTVLTLSQTQPSRCRTLPKTRDSSVNWTCGQ